MDDGKQNGIFLFFSFVNYGQKIYEKRAALLLLASWPRGGVVQANWASAWIDIPGKGDEAVGSWSRP